MQPIAAWLISRPQNAILGLAATYVLFLPLAGIFSGAVMVLLVLHHGVRRPMMYALLAAAVLALMALLSGASAPQMAFAALMSWLPAYVLAALLGNWRSLTLTLQVSVIAASVGLLGFYAVLGDPSVFWSSWLADEAAMLFREIGLHEQAAALVENQAAIAQQMTVLFVFTIWSLYAFGLLLGYALYSASLQQKSVFGRFCDLNFGRVLALIMAVASVAAVLSGAVWLRNFAFLVFVVFWIQGLAILHWLHAERRFPAVLLVVVYALIPLLSALPVLSLAVVGYTDAWFGYRTRSART
ncbi:MAG: hypothetical protein O7D92_03790 [Proteobacteria bacterium]|nr:hypothetical protein [Pseudomonadota bacterium]